MHISGVTRNREMIGASPLTIFNRLFKMLYYVSFSCNKDEMVYLTVKTSFKNYNSLIKIKKKNQKLQDFSLTKSYYFCANQ
jgi:hypothetical protein